MSNTINFSPEQIEGEKTLLRKKIFYLLLVKDPENAGKYDEVDIDAAFDDLTDTMDGLNIVLGRPVEMVNIAAKLAMARAECHRPEFNFRRYRKFILDAGNIVLKIESR